MQWGTNGLAWKPAHVNPTGRLLSPRYEIRKLYMQMRTFVSIWACMKACLDMHPCVVCGSVYLYAHDTRVFSELQLCVCVCV